MATDLTKIENTFIRNHFCADFVEDVGDGWRGIEQAVLNARRVLANPDKFPKADFDYLENLDLEGTSFLLGAPIQYIV